MEWWLCTAAGALFLAACIVALCTRCRTRKIMERMNKMLESAANGSFQESVYDESMISSIETRLAQVLAASFLCEKDLKEEREKVRRLITDISHQTKTPLANLLLYAQMLEEKQLPQEEQTFVQEIGCQAKKLEFLIVSLIRASRLETGMFVLAPEWGDVSRMVEEALGQAVVRADRKRQEIGYVPEHCFAYFDWKWTVEAIYNIVDNAVKYTPEGGKINIRLTNTELFVRIEISDTGIGISEADTAKIFQRFYRGRSAGSEEGIGIGLYLTRQILAGENGYIKVKSVMGEGSSFFVYLPAERMQERQSVQQMEHTTGLKEGRFYH